MRALSGWPFAIAVCFGLAAFALPAREITVQEAVTQSQRDVQGKVLSVQTLNVGKRKVYRIKLLTRDGQVRIVQVAADQPG